MDNSVWGPGTQSRCGSRGDKNMAREMAFYSGLSPLIDLQPRTTQQETKQIPTHMLDPGFQDSVSDGAAEGARITSASPRAGATACCSLCSAVVKDLTTSFTSSFFSCLCFTNSCPNSQIRGPFEPWLLKGGGSGHQLHRGAC